jgi:hypothetical protein
MSRDLEDAILEEINNIDVNDEEEKQRIIRSYEGSEELISSFIIFRNDMIFKLDLIPSKDLIKLLNDIWGNINSKYFKYYLDIAFTINEFNKSSSPERYSRGESPPRNRYEGPTTAARSDRRHPRRSIDEDRITPATAHKLFPKEEYRGPTNFQELLSVHKKALSNKIYKKAFESYMKERIGDYNPDRYDSYESYKEDKEKFLYGWLNLSMDQIKRYMKLAEKETDEKYIKAYEFYIKEKMPNLMRYSGSENLTNDELIQILSGDWSELSQDEKDHYLRLAEEEENKVSSQEDYKNETFSIYFPEEQKYLSNNGGFVMKYNAGDNDPFLRIGEFRKKWKNDKKMFEIAVVSKGMSNNELLRKNFLSERGVYSIVTRPDDEIKDNQRLYFKLWNDKGKNYLITEIDDQWYALTVGKNARNLGLKPLGEYGQEVELMYDPPEEIKLRRDINLNFSERSISSPSRNDRSSLNRSMRNIQF